MRIYIQRTLKYVVDVKSFADAGSQETDTTATLHSKRNISSDQSDGSEMVKDLRFARLTTLSLGSLLVNGHPSRVRGGKLKDVQQAGVTGVSFYLFNGLFGTRDRRAQAYQRGEAGGDPRAKGKGESREKD